MRALTPAEQVRRFSQFCIWLRLDVRYQAAPTTKGIAGCTPVVALRRVLEWSQRQATGQHKESRFERIGETVIAPKTTIAELIHWVFEEAEELPGLERPIGVEIAADELKYLVADWQYHLLTSRDEQAPQRVHKILAALADVPSPLRDLIHAVEGEEAVAPVDAPAVEAAPAAAPAHAVAQSGPASAPQRRKASSSTLLLVVALALLGVAAASWWTAPARKSPAAAQVQPVKTASVAVTSKTSQQGAQADPASVPAQSGAAAGAAPASPAQPRAAAGAANPATVATNSDDLLRFTLVAKAGAQLYEVGPHAPLPSRTHFYFRLQAERLMYVMLCEFRADGSLRPLFPTFAHDRQESWPLRAHRVEEIPPPETGMLELDDSPGDERLLIVAATVPLGERDLPLDRALAKVAWRSDWTPRPAFAHKALASAPKPLTRGVDFVHSTSAAQSADDARVVAHFVTIRHTAK